jgi:RimJ/RimL family protein N-acetyltransferase
MLDMPILETARLLIRPFVMEDLPDVHRLLDIELHDADLHADKMESMAERAAWLQWSVLNYVQLAKLYQPPYGDRAAVLKSSGQFVGACGFVPCLAPFELLPGFGPGDNSGRLSRYSPEFGLFYAISPTHRRQGYATEAAQALVDYALRHLHLKRVVATTDYDNLGSLGVMRKLGMRIEKNPRREPPWLQVVGVVENNP